MRLLFLPTAAAVLGAAILALSARAASPRHYPPYAPRALTLPILIGRASRRIGFPSGDTVTTRAMIRITLFVCS
jgi:hypothetical protein